MSTCSVSILAYPGNIIQYSLEKLTLYFQVGVGATRIEGVPRGLFPLADPPPHMETYLNGLFKKYQEAIVKIGKRWNLTLPKDPLACLVAFSERITQNKFHEQTTLSLAGFKLTILPPQIALFQDLRKLDLSENQLRMLFPELPHLDSLEELDLSGNSGVLIQNYDLSRLPNLKTVKLVGCGLTAIPQWMSQSRSLEVIDVRGNWIQSVPEALKAKCLLDDDHWSSTDSLFLNRT